MSKPVRVVLIALAVIVVVIVVAISAIPLFLNGNNFRNRIQASLTQALGRQVAIGKVDISVWSGGLLAQNVTVADDPQFSTQPFLAAKSVTIHVAPLPLIFHHQVQISGFVLKDPMVDLVRASNGAWNYSTMGHSGAQPAQPTAAAGPNPLNGLTAGHIEIQDATITVSQLGGGAVAAQNRTYRQVDLDIKDFSSVSSFPFTFSASLPGQGTLSAKGTAGPINQQDASNTPFTLHLDGKHLDPLAAGLVDSSSGVSGVVNSISVDAAWTGQSMHISKLTVDSPQLTVIETAAPKPQPAPQAGKSSFLQNLTVDDAEIKNGSVTLSTPGKPGAPVVYQNINASVSGMTPQGVSPFSVSAQLPAGGSLQASGKAGPFNAQNNAATPVDAQVTLKQIHLGSAGVLPPDAGIDGVMDLQAQVQSNGQTLQANGKAQVAGIRLARNATPSPKPLDVQFTVAENQAAKTGDLQHAVLSVGGAVINVSGTFHSGGPSTGIAMKVVGDAVPIDALEAFLPSLGIRLPEGSQLRGGALTTSLGVSGTTASSVIDGPVKLSNTQLAGFNLGAKLGPLMQLTGGRVGAATGNGTNIRVLSMDLHEQGGNIRTDHVDLEIAGIGTATGNGSVSAGGALDYAVVLKLNGLGGAAQSAPAAQHSGGGLVALAGGFGGLLPGGASSGLGSIGGLLSKGIPVQISGTSAHPVFTPNMRGLAGSLGAGAAQRVLKGNTQQGQPSPANQLKKSLGGLLGH